MYVNGKSLIRTRFAPSPTGQLHIGGARTALFNYLFARRYGGSFVLRIDDTDKERNIDTATKPVLDSLKWLGINWDEGPICQSDRTQHYKDVAEALIRLGCAYPDPPTPWSDNKQAYRGVHRNVQTQVAFELWDDTDWCLRYKVEEGQRIVFDDLIRGQVAWDTNNISDPVILRKGGTATYNFATAIDDAEMKITHVIRAEEHLSNTPIQIMIMHDLGYVPPLYAHVPFVCEPGSHKKLSKRDVAKFITPEVVSKLRAVGFSDDEIMKREELNPTTLTYYRALGFKPAAVTNYLARLGWSLDGETEIMTLDQMQENFSLERVNSSPAQFDPKKMTWVSGEHLRHDDLRTKTLQSAEFLAHAKMINHPVKKDDMDRVRKVVELCGERLKVYSDIIPYGSFFFRDPVYNQKEVDKHLTHENVALLDVFCQLLKFMKTWNAEEIQKQLKEFMETRGLKVTRMIFALRVAITGNMIGPGLFETMEFLGQDKCVQRIRRALEYVPITYPGDL